MKKEQLKYIDKVWGEEIWLVNGEYCGKLLVIDNKAQSSYHFHRNKTETFFCIEGYCTLIVEGKEELLAPFTRPKTIMAGEKHKFCSITPSVILEISTHHEEADVVRLTDSKPGEKNEYGMVE